MENKYHMIMLSEDDKSKMVKLTYDVIELIVSRTSNNEERAYILKVLVEGFQDSTGKRIPIQEVSRDE